MIGRTIVAIEEDKHGNADAVVRLDDGSSIELRAEGWEVDGVSWEHFDAEATAGLDAKRAKEAGEAAAADYKAKLQRIEVDFKRATLSPEDFDAWQLKRLGPFWYVFSHEMQRQSEMMALLLNGSGFNTMAPEPKPAWGTENPPLG